MFVSHFVVVLDRFFHYERQKKVVPGHVRQEVVLYSNDCMGICLGRLSIGHLRQVIVLWMWSFEWVWLYLLRKLFKWANKKMSEFQYLQYYTFCKKIKKNT